MEVLACSFISIVIGYYWGKKIAYSEAKYLIQRKIDKVNEKLGVE